MKSLVFITRDLVTRNTVEKLLKESYRLVFFSSVPSALDYIYTSMPDLIILDTALDDHWTGEILSELKSDPTFGQVPVLRICDEGVDMPSWDHVFVDDYVRRCSLEAETHSRVRLCLERSERFVDINPLTRLPGNIAITKEIQHWLDKGEGFCLAWADLDDFKPFNDRYGFARGDEVLKMMARLILNTVKEIQPQGAFVGHVGGDDFVFMVSCDVLPDVADRIIDNFDRIIPIFYDEDDRTKGFIESVDRMSRKHVFPIISVSIGVAHNQLKKFLLAVEITEIASEMKKFAKQTRGSCYRIDQRR
jgi:GGDEF domain-containing protein